MMDSETMHQLKRMLNSAIEKEKRNNVSIQKQNEFIFVKIHRSTLK